MPNQEHSVLLAEPDLLDRVNHVLAKFVSADHPEKPRFEQFTPRSRADGIVMTHLVDIAQPETLSPVDPHACSNKEHRAHPVEQILELGVASRLDSHEVRTKNDAPFAI